MSRYNPPGQSKLVPLLDAVLLAACVLLAPETQAAAVTQFTFGTPESVTRAGFAKVTVKDAFTPEKGYGFQSLKGLLAYDRGGSAIALPKDEYTASVYGAYRTTSDITCALIEGQGDNAFLVSLPDGDYTVWLIACDADWDPPLFEVWANGQKKLEVRVPRAKFVYMEPFQARATDGRLQIELKGQHGWILSGLVIAKEGPELDEAVARLQRDIFFLTEPELPNWKEAKTAPPNPTLSPVGRGQGEGPLELTEAERQKGYVVFPSDYSETILPSYVPARSEIGKPITAFATPGEIEPATFCVSALKDLEEVHVELSDFVREGTALDFENVSVGIVRCRPVRITETPGKGEYRVVPNMIEPPLGRACRVPAGEVKQWWLTVRVPQDTPPGRYRMWLTLWLQNAEATRLEWRLLVLPFSLQRPADKHWGTWMDRFPPVGGLNGPARRGRNLPAEVERLAQADMNDFREHGFDLVLLNYYFDAKENPDGTFSYDVPKLARDLEYCKLLGSSAPVVLTLEYTCRNFEYGFAEVGQKHVPGTFSPKAHKAIVGLVQYIHDEAQRRAWPKLYYAPIDEPGNNKTENRMLFGKNVLSFVHEVPGCQTAATITAGDVQRLGDLVDVRIYAYGHFNRNKVVQEAQQGHPFWYYNNGMFYGHSTISSRGYAGFEFLRSGAEVATAWGFAATQCNPCNGFDGGHRDWNVIFPGVDAPAPTIYWELCREGVDDCRYVETLRQQIRQARERGQSEAAQRAERVLAPLLDPEAARIANPLAFARYRWRIAREILNLLGEQKLALPFPAVVNNAAASEKAGPNLIENPSFENGPQTDGFPGGGYHIADPYAKLDTKPVGALAVTGDEAHSGRFSLKWDFSKAAGKGFLYAKNRYLVVNVQVPPEAAKSLRGRRVKVGYWFRLGGGSLLPGMSLRQFGKGEFLGGIEYKGGVQDPAVWNHFEVEGRLRGDFEGLDIHISCRVPEDDPELAKKSFFFIDDVSLQAIEEPPLAVAAPLDEYYVGETVPWTVSASAAGQLRVALLAAHGNDAVAPVQEQTLAAAAAPPLTLPSPQWGEGGVRGRGAFESRALKPGIYTLQATLTAPPQAPQTAQQQIILAPDPFEWVGISNAEPQRR